MRSIKNSLLFLYIILSGCGASHYTLSSYGDETIIYFKDNKELKCELINLQDSIMIISPIIRETPNYTQFKKHYYSLRLGDIDSVAVHGLNSDGWGTPVVIFQIVPAGLLAIAAASVDADALSVFAISAIPGLVTSLLFSESEEETPGYKNRADKTDFEKIKIYCRYPEQLSSDEIMILLESSGQKILAEYRY